MQIESNERLTDRVVIRWTKDDAQLTLPGQWTVVIDGISVYGPTHDQRDVRLFAAQTMMFQQRGEK